MSEIIDQPQKVRSEDSLDHNILSAYLKKHLPAFSDSQPLSIQQFSGGASNLTYLLSWGNDIQQQAILRTAPRGANIKSAHDMGREYKVLKMLDGHFAYSPDALLYCDDEGIIGRPFYLMEKVEGIIARKSFPMPVSQELAHNLCKQLIDVHIALHETDLDSTGLINLGKAEGYIQRQILGWNQRYSNAIIEDSLPATELMKYLVDHMPEDKETCLIHNDYKFDNVVISPEQPHKIIAVLDWEMTTIGSPLMDLGCSLAYWIEKDDHPAMQAIRMMPTHLDGMMTRQQIVEYYAQKRGIQIDEFNYYYVFGLFRLAVIVQQIYKRYAQGKTTNPAFAPLGEVAKVLITRASRLIE